MRQQYKPIRFPSWWIRHMIPLVSLFFTGTTLVGQDSLNVRSKGVFYPAPMTGQKWRSSIGFISVGTPIEITESAQLRAPCGDWHVMHRITDNFIVDGRLLFQVLQNQLSVGLRYNTKVGDRFCVGVGDDVAYWMGHLHVGGFDSDGRGWSNFPNVSFGYRFGKEYLLTLKGEALITTSFKAYNGDLVTVDLDNRFSGTAVTLALEQPFYNQKHVTLAFTAMYTDFNWLTWSLFSTFDRRIFYPQITVGFIL